MLYLLYTVANASASALTASIYHPISESHIEQVVALHQCLNTNSLGQLWTSSMPFLYPFIIQFRYHYHLYLETKEVF